MNIYVYNFISERKLSQWISGYSSKCEYSFIVIYLFIHLFIYLYYIYIICMYCKYVNT